MQHDMTERHALGDRRAAETRRTLGPFLRRQPVSDETARGDRLGKHHGGGLQGLDLLVAVLPLGAVLHREHADGAAAAQDRHADEGVIDFLPRLGAVGEGRMKLSVGQLHRLGRRAIRPTRPSPGLQMRVVDGDRVQAFRREQFERSVAAAQVERAHLGDHVRGDQHHDLVEARLHALARGHDLAQAAQQLPRGANRSSHKQQSSPNGRAAVPQ